MTFEEFFLKKKIDLDLFKRCKPDVFAEFVFHYEQMSEKSFDHTKKYWFNNLRNDYPLSDAKEQELKEIFKPKSDAMSSQETVEKFAENTQTPGTKVSGFKPRFKAPLNSEGKLTESDSPKPEISEFQPPKLAGFKPRFKAGMTAAAPKAGEPAKQEEISPEIQSLDEKLAVAKPAGFKPRFKAGITASAPQANEAEKSEAMKKESPIDEKSGVVKPAGFKPRFKAGVMASVPKIENEEKLEEVKLENSSGGKTEVTKPLGFKPRFKTAKKED